MEPLGHPAALPAAPPALPGFEAFVAPPIRPRYELAVSTRMARFAGQRAWDMYRDVVAPVYDEVRDDVHECIGLVCAFVEHVTGEPLDSKARSLIARGVRMHGKAIVYGFDQALTHVTDSDDVSAMFKYATAVARNQVTQHRARSNGNGQ